MADLELIAALVKASPIPVKVMTGSLGPTVAGPPPGMGAWCTSAGPGIPGPLQRDQRDGVTGQSGVLVGGWADPPELEQGPHILGTIDHAGPDPKAVRADSHMCGTDISEVQPPRRWSGVPGVGRHDHSGIPYLQIDHRDFAQLPGAATGDLEEQHRRTKPSAADPAVGAAVDPRM